MSVSHNELASAILGQLENERLVMLQTIIPDGILVKDDKLIAVEICRNPSNEQSKLRRGHEYKQAGYDSLRIITPFRRENFDNTYGLSGEPIQPTFKISFESNQRQAGYIAGIIDISGRFGMRLGSVQFMPFITIYSRDLYRLRMLEELGWPFGKPIEMSKGLYGIHVNAYRRIKDLLEPSLPYMRFQEEVAGIMLKLVNSRLEHPNSRYTVPELHLMKEIVQLTSRPRLVNQRLEVINRWLDR